MQTEKNSAKKAKTHTVYKNAASKRVPGCTTIVGVMDKPALVGWANRIGLEGIEVRRYVDDLAVIGTCAHYLIECHIRSKIEKKKIVPELSDYTKNQIDSAKNSFNKFLDWEKQHTVEYLGSEMLLVSEKYQFGGQCDIYCIIDGVYTLADIKTCKAIYSDHGTQVGGGYNILLQENGYKVEDVIIIRVGRDDVEGFEARKVPLLSEHIKRFLICKQLYDINKNLNRW